MRCMQAVLFQQDKTNVSVTDSATRRLEKCTSALMTTADRRTRMIRERHHHHYRIHLMFIVPPSRYSCSTYPSASNYPVPSSSPSYSHIPPQPLTHYGDPRYMEMSPRDDVPILHHLPQQPSTLDRSEHSRQSMEGAAQLLPSCEQGNETV